MPWGVANPESGDYCGEAEATTVCTTAGGKHCVGRSICQTAVGAQLGIR